MVKEQGSVTLVVTGTVVGEVSVTSVDTMADQMVVMVRVVVVLLVLCHVMVNALSLIVGVGVLGKMLLRMFLTTLHCPLAREDGIISVLTHSGILLTSAVGEGG